MELRIREKPAVPKTIHPLLALRVGCDWCLATLAMSGLPV